jgi:methionyl aminopeptidase
MKTIDDIQKMIPRYDVQDFEGLRKAGKLAAQALDYITPFVIEGVSTGHLDKLLEKFIEDNRATPACLGYHGYPKVSCISPNHVVCHGIPEEGKKLNRGDIVNIDVTVIVDGYFGDTSRMYYVGVPSIKGDKLTRFTYEALMAAIAEVKPGVPFSRIGRIISSMAREKNYGVVEDFCGHGIGKSFHHEPNVVHYYDDIYDNLLMQEGMVFTIEPMINIGKPETMVLSNNWTAVTRDKSLSAQFEHQVGVTKDGCEIFTLSPAGYEFPPYKKG